VIDDIIDRFLLNKILGFATGILKLLFLYLRASITKE